MTSRKILPKSIAIAQNLTTQTLRAGEAWTALAATQARIARMQWDALRQARSLTLRTMAQAAPIWAAMLSAGLRGPGASLRGPWAR
jgi:hypothetical protein